MSAHIQVDGPEAGGLTASQVLQGMHEVCCNLVAHFRDNTDDGERALGHQQEVAALEAAVELIAADIEYDAAERALSKAGPLNAAGRVAAFRRYTTARDRRTAALATCGAIK